MKNISNYFGCLVFDDRVMKANLSSNTKHPKYSEIFFIMIPPRYYEFIYIKKGVLYAFCIKDAFAFITIQFSIS